MKKSLMVVCSMLFLAFMTVPCFAQKGKIVDWNGSLEDEPEKPVWLQQMKRGNATAYCSAYGLTSKMNRKWLTPVAAESYIGWEDGLIAARADTMASLGEALATEITASTYSNQDNGTKSNIRKIVLESVNSVAGLEFEGYHWYEVEKEVQIGLDKKGKPITQKRNVWYVYAFYSMDNDNYKKQMLTALYKINLASGLSPEDAKKIAATSWADIVKLEQDKEAHEKAIKEEQDKQLLNHKLSLENRDKTMQEKGQDYQYNIDSRNLDMQARNQDYQYNLDNRNIDTQQMQVRETTKQVEIKSKAATQQVQAASASEATQAVAGPAPVQNNSSGSGFDAGDVISDAMAFLLGL